MEPTRADSAMISRRITQRLRWPDSNGTANAPLPRPEASRVTPASQVLISLLQIADKQEFLRQAYLRLFDRPIDWPSEVGFLRKMRWMPFLYTRRRVLLRLLGTAEAAKRGFGPQHIP